MNKINYFDGYKYQLAERYTHKLPEEFMTYPSFKFLFITFKNGILSIAPGYAWDGASGPAIDTKTIMRASLVHDALYMSIRQGHLPPYVKSLTDKEFKRICLEDGMFFFRAWYIYKGVDWFGYKSTVKLKSLKTAP